VSTRARSHRPAPWKYSGWKDAPGALPAIPIPGADVAEPGTVPDNLRSYKVAVLARRASGYEAYTRFCDGLPGACIHHVSATSGAEAKPLAIAEHIRACLHKERAQ
jgi:hypothetical protein